MTSDELFDADESARHPLGWGPYIIETWKLGEYIRLVKNPYYFRADEGLPYFDELIIRFYGQDEDSTLSALKNGECDLIDYEQALKNTSLERLIEADKNGQIRAFITTATTWEHLDFNLHPPQTSLNNDSLGFSDLDGDGQGPFGDVRLRQAIAMCLDRQKLVDELFYGYSSVPDTYLPSNHPLFNPQAIRWMYDPEAAGVLLDEIGWLDTDDNPETARLSFGVTGVPDDTPLVLVYDTTEAAIRQQVFQIMADSLGSCGIQVHLLTYPANQFFKADPEGIVFGRLFGVAEFAWLTGVVPPCDLFLSTNIPTLENNWSGNNTVGYINPEYDTACNLQFRSLPGGPDYIQGVMEAQRIFSEQLPVIPLFMQIKYAAARSDLCGYWMDSSSTSDFWNIEAFEYGDGCK
jgi:peptide/nickel transport system substrate-binding protein